MFAICVILLEVMFTFEGGHKTKSPKINISLLFGVFHELAFLKDSFQNQDLRLNFLMLEPTQRKLASIFLITFDHS